jgi:hypothetical protein
MAHELLRSPPDPYPRLPVSTRKLIVLALLCGLAILVAGGIQLFRISDRDDRTVEVLDEGQPATVGSVTVAVEDSTFDGTVIRAMVRMSAVEETSVPLSSFTLLVGGRLEQVLFTEDAPGQCGESTTVDTEPTTCDLAFAGREGTATFAFSRDGDQALWRLEPAAG